MSTLYDFRATTIDGQDEGLDRYRGRVLLIVNVASACGLTPQYEGLEALQRAHHEQGFDVLGFPCNQFGAQEPGSEAEIKQFCQSRYDVTFPLFAKVEVNGPNRHPLFAWLSEEATLPEGAGDLNWNFTKFLVSRKGEVIARFAPKRTPDDPELEAMLARLLNEELGGE